MSKEIWLAVILGFLFYAWFGDIFSPRPSLQCREQGGSIRYVEINVRNNSGIRPGRC